MTTETSDRTRITILVADEIAVIPIEKLAKKLKKLGVPVIEILAERLPDE